MSHWPQGDPTYRPRLTYPLVLGDPGDPAYTQNHQDGPTGEGDGEVYSWDLGSE